MKIKVYEVFQTPTEEVEIVKSSYTQCDKCKAKMTDFPGQCQLKLSEGLYKMELCKKCTKDLADFFTDNGYRLVDETA